MSEALLRAGLAMHQAGQFDGAAKLYRDVLKTTPNQLDALYLLGFLHFQRGDFSAALELYDRALNIKPDFVEALVARGPALSSLERHKEALAAYERLLGLRPSHVESWNNRGNALLALSREREAVASYDRALALKNDYAEAWRNRGVALLALERFEDALSSYDRALALNPARADWWEGKALLLAQQGQREAALSAYDRAIALGPNNADLLYNRGNTHAILGNYDQAIDDCEAALRLDPDYPYARGVLVHAKFQACDWAGLEAQAEKIQAALADGRRVISPFSAKALLDSPGDQLRAAELWVAHESPPASAPLVHSVRYNGDRIRLAYVSGDFNASAVATLMAGIFERHDRGRFETIAVSYGPATPTPMRKRLESAFERFSDVRGRSDGDIARLMRGMNIDIAVDLTGLTGEARSGIFGLRPAPVQVNYLGFPGTMGASYMDYIIADAFVALPDQDRFYAEQVVRLRHCFLPTDSGRAIAEVALSRAQAGLPEQGFVFASFNNSYKFAPTFFDIWMRLLHEVEGSVLWLPENNAFARRNLAREAERRGIEAKRLIFAPPIAAPEDHLARLGLADLFLDTLPYNAHTTAVDALWACVPVLTLPGRSFAGRVAASAVMAAGLPELIARSPADYEAKAMGFARDPELLARVRAKLAINRRQCPLFDSDRFTRGLEKAFVMMHERRCAGLPPASFMVEHDA